MQATDHLLAEHEKISSMLRVLERMCEHLKKGDVLPREQIEDLLLFFELFSDQLHHAKEEEILLPALIQSGFPWKGGPLCSYFKQMQMWDESIQEQVKALNQEFELNLIFDSDPFSPKRSLPVLEEHVLGRALVRVLRLEIAKPSSFTRFARRFISLLDAHIDKENRCLFPMLDDTLNSEEQQKLTSQFCEMEKKFLNQERFQQLEQKWNELRSIWV